MTLRVFVASSTEGLPVAEAIQKLLKQNLGEKADVTLWTQKFKYGATYIESLEEVSREADSAVLVFTPDDITKSREADKLAPRDNVVFELGLFTGGIGRDRCILVHEDSPKLKLPTDLLGVNAATFRRQKALKASLTPMCGRISEQINSMGSRHKLSPRMLATQAAIRDFYDRIKGAWCERIEEPGSNYSISLAQIKWDAPYNSVKLEGTVYDEEALPKAHWNSEMARFREDEQKIFYLRRCWHPGARNKSWLHGIGDINFKGPVEPELLNRGDGKFSQFDEANPKRTLVKYVEFRRVIDDDKAVAIMNNGRKKDREALLKKMLRLF